MLGLLSGIQIAGILVVVLFVFGRRKMQELWKGMQSGWLEFRSASRGLKLEIKQTDLVADALTPDNQTAEFRGRTAEEVSMKSKFIVWIAQGFGIGRIPFAPGTWGSLLGVVWSVLLFALCPLAILAVAVLLSVLLAVWICGAAERILGEKDPGSIVLDEIVAMPIVYASFPVFFTWLSVSWDGKEWQKLLFAMPPTPHLTALLTWWPILLAGFLLFRLFDIWKPWPVRPLQKLPGGWGVVVDDLAAAVLANVALFLGTSAASHLFH